MRNLIRKILKESEDEFDWVRQLLTEPIASLVVGQIYRCTPSDSDFDFNYNLDVKIIEIGNDKVIYTSKCDAQDRNDYETYNNMIGDTSLQHGIKLVADGYWVPIKREDSLFK